MRSSYMYQCLGAYASLYGWDTYEHCAQLGLRAPCMTEERAARIVLEHDRTCDEYHAQPFHDVTVVSDEYTPLARYDIWAYGANDWRGVCV